MIAALTPTLSTIAGAGATGIAVTNPITVAICTVLLGASMFIRPKTQSASPSGKAVNATSASPMREAPLPDHASVDRKTALNPTRNADNQAIYADPFRVEDDAAAVNQQRGVALVRVMSWLLNSYLESKAKNWRAALKEDNRSPSFCFCGSHLNLKAIAEKLATEHNEHRPSLNTTTKHLKRALQVLDSDWRVEEPFTKRELRFASWTMVALAKATAKSLASKQCANQEELEILLGKPDKVVFYLTKAYPLPSHLSNSITVSCINFYWP